MARPPPRSGSKGPMTKLKPEKHNKVKANRVKKRRSYGFRKPQLGSSSGARCVVLSCKLRALPPAPCSSSSDANDTTLVPSLETLSRRALRRAGGRSDVRSDVRCKAYITSGSAASQTREAQRASRAMRWTGRKQARTLASTWTGRTHTMQTRRERACETAINYYRVRDLLLH